MEYICGKITKLLGGFYYVLTEKGVFECRAKGKFRKESFTPLVGDNVKIAVLDEDKQKGNLEEVFPRKSAFIRPPVANIDVLVITISACEPSPDLLLADKLSVIAQKAGVSVYFCINKMDLDTKTANEIYDIYKNADFKTFLTNTKNLEGIDELKEALIGKICAFAGNSGVGKSSLLNAILSRDDIETGDISDKIKRGKNTTRHTELIACEGGGSVLDTPGFSSFTVSDIKALEIESFFPEIKKYKDGCRFSGCAHINEPDCSVKEALVKGKIAQSRYDNYVEIYNSLKDIKEWMK